MFGKLSEDLWSNSYHWMTSSNVDRPQIPYGDWIGCIHSR